MTDFFVEVILMQNLFKLLSDNPINATEQELRFINSTNHLLLPHNRSFYVPFLIAEAARVSTAELVNSIFLLCETASGTIMFPYQEQFSKRVIRSILENSGDEITALFARQSGKCFAKGTEILMSDGSIKKVEDIRVGDFVMRPDSTPTRVTSLGHGREEMFEVVSREKNHESFTVNKSHILALVDRRGKYKNIEVEEYLSLSDWNHKDNLRGYRVPVDYPQKKTPIEPYFMGVWLGDGSSHDVKITNVDSEVVDYLREYSSRLGLQLSTYSTKNKVNDYAITNGRVGKGKDHTFNQVNPLRRYLEDNNLIGNKHIPDVFMLNSREVRLELLAGLIDSDGHRSTCSGKENVLEISQSNPVLAKDTLRLIRSLGFRASMSRKLTYLNGGTFVCYRISAYGDFSCVPTLIQRKKWNKDVLRESPLTFGFDLIPKGVDDYYGFTIDSPDHLFLLSDYTVVHNTETIASTVCGLMIVLPQLANMPMFVDDLRLRMFTNGLWVGIFAPSQRQASITYGRTKSRLLSKSAQAVLNDADFKLSFTTSNGQTVALSNGSFSTAISASDGSNIEGESFKLIILEECLPAGSKIFTVRGEVNVEDVKEGECVYAYDHAQGLILPKLVKRSFSQPLRDRKMVNVSFENGEVLRCTDNHKVFVQNRGYVRADTLQIDDLMLSYLCTTQEYKPQVLKIIGIQIEEPSEHIVYDLTVEDCHNFFANGVLVHNCQDISNFKIRKSIHPMGAAYNATLVKIGTATTFKGDFYDAIVRNKLEFEGKTTNIRNHFEYDCDVAAKYNPKYAKYLEKERKRLGENSDEFLMSYKLKWIISRGMFIDIIKFEQNNLESLLERTMQDTQATHVVGIDVGGKGDDTIITVVEVDWNMPVILETQTNDETGEDETYTAYNTYIKDWHVISNQPDYEEQYPEIVNYLEHFNVARVVIDATREAALAHRLRANLKSEVVPFIFTQKSKSDVYKHLDKEIASGRARVCAGSKTVETREYQDFIEQLGDLQKGYSGANLIVSHPEERGAHDDFPDSWSLAVWGASFRGEPDNTETRPRNPFTERSHNESQYSRRLNKLTARRR